MTDDLRIARLEESEARAWKAIDSLAEKQEKLDDALVALLESQIKTEERFRDTDAHLRDLASETNARFRETDAHLRDLAIATDERISKLVSAIGEFVRKG